MLKGLIIWDSETLNTDPDQIVWGRDRATFIPFSSGLYLIMYGFLADIQPPVYLGIDGVQTSLHPLKKANATQNAISKLAWFTYFGVVEVNSKSKISVHFKEKFSGEGFLWIRKF